MRQAGGHHESAGTGQGGTGRDSMGPAAVGPVAVGPVAVGQSGTGRGGVFLLIDPSIAGPGGHHLEYAQRVLGSAARAGFATHAGIHARAEVVLEGHGVTRAFRYGSFETPAPMPGVARRARAAILGRGRTEARPTTGGDGGVRSAAGVEGERGPARRASLLARARGLVHARAFAGGLSRACVGACVAERIGSTIFIPTLTLAEIRGLARASLPRARSGVPTRVALVLRHPPEQLLAGADGRGAGRGGNGLASALRAARERLVGVCGCEVAWWTDTRELSEAYEPLLGVWPGVLPIPVVGVGGAGVVADAVVDAPHLVVLGDARLEKGYHLLPGVVEAVARLEPRARWTIQSNAPMVALEPEAALARERLRRMARVRLVESALDAASYHALLRSADAIVLPYDPARYRERSSGIFTEALAEGVPVVVPRGTWMASELRRLAERSGGAAAMPGAIVALSDGPEAAGVQGLAQGIAMVAARGGPARAAARAGAAAWRSAHHPDRLVTMLTGADAAPAPRGNDPA